MAVPQRRPDKEQTTIPVSMQAGEEVEQDRWSTDGTILIKTLDHKFTVVRNGAELGNMCIHTVHGFKANSMYWYSIRD